MPKIIGQEYSTKAINGGNDIEVWCLEKDTNKPFVVVIKHFTPWCYLETGLKTKEENESFLKELKSKFSNLTFDGVFTENFKLYYYQSRKTSFLQLFFKTVYEMETFTREIKGNYTRKSNYKNLPPMIVWESDKKFLTNVDRFYNMTDLKHGDWMEFKGVTEGEMNDTYTEDNYCLEFPDNNGRNTVSTDQVSTDHQSHKKYLQKHIKRYVPPEVMLSCPKKCSWDIECYASNHNRFVNAKCNGDVMYMISFIFQASNASDKSAASHKSGVADRTRYLVILKNTKIDPSFIHADPRFENTEVMILDNEAEFFTAIGTIFKKENPDVIIGYNTHRFDYSYVITRQLQLLNTKIWNQHLSRNKEKLVESIERTWKSSAYGTVTEIYPDMCGRISIDMLLFVKNVLAAKLNTYTLNAVSSYFLKKEKDDVSAKQMFEWYKSAFTEFSNGDLTPSENMGKVGLYGLQDSELVMDLFDKLNVWPTLVELSGVAGISIEQIFRGQQIRVMSLLCGLCYKNDIVIDSRDHHNFTLIKRKEEGEMDPDGDDSVGDEDKESINTDEEEEKDRQEDMKEGILRFKGAFVKEPIPGKYNNVICVDFASLYPSIIIDRNISYDTFNVKCSPLEEAAFSNRLIDEYPHLKEAGIKKKKKDKRYGFHEDNGENTIKMDFYDTLKEEGEFDTTKVPFYHLEFTKEKKGLLPTLVKNLIDTRKTVKKQMNECIDTLKALDLSADPIKRKNLELAITILNQRQNALKVTANSTYGFVGAQKIGKLPFGELSMAVTATGRQYIRRVNAYVKEKYNGEIVYGDTDSSMFTIPSITNSKECNEVGVRLAAELSELFEGGTIKLEFEKAMRMICFKKKKYAAFLLDDNGEFCESKMLFRGIVLARRDNCSLLRDVYKKLLIEILSNDGVSDDGSESYKKCYKLIYGTLVDLFREKKYSLDELKEILCIVNEYKGEYKNVNYKTCVYATESEVLGRPVQAGERISFLIAKEPITQKPVHSSIKLNNLGLKMRDVKYFDPKRDEIDYFYYISHSFQDPIDQLFSIAFNKDDRVNVKMPLNHFEKKVKENIKKIKKVDKGRFAKGIKIDDIRLENDEYKEVVKSICRDDI